MTAPASVRTARVLAAAATVALLDGAFAVTLCHGFRRACTVGATFRGIASYAPAWFPGAGTAVTGALLHAGVATLWTAVYLLLYRRLAALRTLTTTRNGIVATALGVGITVWLAMDLVVLPLVGRGRHTPVRSLAFWLILAGHPAFVGWPIAVLVRRPPVTGQPLAPRS